MAAIVIPFRGESAKRRLGLGASARAALAHAMLADVLASAGCTGSVVVVVTSDPAATAIASAAAAAIVADPGGGQGAAVAAGLAVAADGPALVLNADLPCASAADIDQLLHATPARGLAVVAAPDGTTNALGLSHASVFAPLYGPGSARRYLGHARRLGLDAVTAAIPGLVDDVDTQDDLVRVAGRAGPRTLAAVASLGLAA